MRDNALRCIANTHREEGSDTPSGGWTINPSDTGNWTGGKKGVGELKGTKFGIAANTYPNLDIKNLTREAADIIYIRDYWPKAWGDDWPMGFDQITYDATVNSGPGRGPLWTCRALGFPKADRAAIAKAKAIPLSEKIAAIQRAVSGQRMGFLRSLGTFAHFGKGWTGRCARMEAIGVKMAMEEAKLPTRQQGEILTKESGKAKTTSTTSGGGAVGTGAGGGAGGAKIDTAAWDSADWLLAGAGALALTAIIVFLGWHAWKHRARAQAYLDAAKGLIGG